VHITCTGNKEKDSAHNLVLAAENMKSKEGAHNLKISHNLNNVLEGKCTLPAYMGKYMGTVLQCPSIIVLYKSRILE
jgi:hypothetical protein